MASIVLFHSALGLTSSVREFAVSLGQDGHVVITPDLFDGETFQTVADGIRKRDALGIPELMRRAAAAVETAPPDSIYAGFSMGAAAAQFLSVSRPGARAAVLMHAVLPLSAFGVEHWPGVPVQIHAAEGDPWVDDSSLAAFVRASSAEVFRYPGDGHLFAELGSSEYDAPSTAALERRVRAFARRCDAGQ